MKIQIIPTEPRCGDCTACCETMGFTGQWSFADVYKESEQYGVDFGAWSTCNRLCETGCSIQKDKPRVCDEFFCHFIEHNLDDKFRPKEFGYVAYTSPDNRTKIMSLDHDTSVEDQYNNDKEMLNELAEAVRISKGEEYIFASLHTKQGTKRIK